MQPIVNSVLSVSVDDVDGPTRREVDANDVSRANERAPLSGLRKPGYPPVRTRLRGQPRCRSRLPRMFDLSRDEDLRFHPRRRQIIYVPGPPTRLPTESDHHLSSLSGPFPPSSTWRPSSSPVSLARHGVAGAYQAFDRSTSSHASSNSAAAPSSSRASAVTRTSGWVPLARRRNQPSPASTRTPSRVSTSS